MKKNQLALVILKIFFCLMVDDRKVKMEIRFFLNQLYFEFLLLAVDQPITEHYYRKLYKIAGPIRSDFRYSLDLILLLFSQSDINSSSCI